MQRKATGTPRAMPKSNSAKSLHLEPSRRISESQADRKGPTLLRKNTKPYLEMIREVKGDKQRVSRENELESLRKKVRKLEEEKQDYLEREEILVKGMQELQSQVVEKNKNIEEHQYEMQTLHKEIKSMNRENMKEISRLMEENTVLLSRANECEAEHHRKLETMQNDMQQQTDQLRRSSVQKAGLEVGSSQEVSQLREHEKQLLEQLRQYQAQVESLSQQVLSLSEMNRSIAEKHQEKDILALAHENKSMAAFMEQQQNHLTQIDSVNQQLLASREESIVHKEKNTLLMQQLYQKEEECTCLQKKLLTLEDKLQEQKDLLLQQRNERQSEIEDMQNYANQQTLKADKLHNTQQVYLQIQGDKYQQVLAEKDSLIANLKEKQQQAKRQFEHQILTITHQKQSLSALGESKTSLLELQDKHNQLKEDYLALETRYDFTLAQSENNQQKAKELELQVLSMEKQEKLRSLKKTAKREKKNLSNKVKTMGQLTNDYLLQRNSIDNSLYRSKKTYGLQPTPLCQSMSKSPCEALPPKLLLSSGKSSLSQQLIGASQRVSLEVFSPPQFQIDQDLMLQYKPLMMEFKQ